MIVAINDEMLYRIVDYASDIGRTQERIESGKEPEFISQNQAHSRFGKGNVTKWCKAGLVKRYKDMDGKIRSQVRYSLVELKAAAFKCNCFKELTPAAKYEITSNNE